MHRVDPVQPNSRAAGNKPRVRCVNAAVTQNAAIPSALVMRRVAAPLWRS
jgi:hypothetical protein